MLKEEKCNSSYICFSFFLRLRSSQLRPRLSRLLSRRTHFLKVPETTRLRSLIYIRQIRRMLSSYFPFTAYSRLLIQYRIVTPPPPHTHTDVWRVVKENLLDRYTAMTCNEQDVEQTES